VDRAEDDPFDKRRLKRIVMIRRLVIMMSQLRALTLSSSKVSASLASWPPEVPANKNGPGSAWKKWGYQKGRWVRRDTAPFPEEGANSGSPPASSASVNDTEADSEKEPVVLEPGTRAHLRCVVALAEDLFSEYQLGVRREESASGVMRLACELYECVASRLCLVYDLDARVVVNGEPQPLDVLERTVMCIVQRLRSDSEQRKLRLVIRWWRDAPKRTDRGAKATVTDATIQVSADETSMANADHGAAAVTVTHTGGEAGAKAADSDEKEIAGPPTEKLRALYDLEKDSQFAEVQLLIEWGQSRMVRAMLDELGGRQAWCWRTAVTRREKDAMGAIVLQRTFLNKALHLALKHDNCDIATLLLARGADSSLYAESTGYHDLLTSASRDGQSSDMYLNGLIDEAWIDPPAKPANLKPNATVSSDSSQAGESVAPQAGEGGSLDVRKEVVDDKHAQKILRRIYAMLVDADEDDRPRIPDARTHRAYRELCFGEGGDLEIFLLLLLLGRHRLAQLFWERDGRNNPPAFLQSALLACIICRRLAEKPGARGHLKDNLLQAKGKFEHITASILQVRIVFPAVINLIFRLLYRMQISAHLPACSLSAVVFLRSSAHKSIGMRKQSNICTFMHPHMQTHTHAYTNTYIHTHAHLHTPDGLPARHRAGDGRSISAVATLPLVDDCRPHLPRRMPLHCASLRRHV
jgi:hypothetical protein